MKKVTAFVGSGRKRHTQRAVEQFLGILEALGGVETEIVRLSDFRIETCRGCYVCFDRGEEFCPLKDDRDALFGKIESSDGVVFASPNYSFHVSGFMKTFLDRLGFVFHRPRYFGKTFTSLVVQGVYGGGKIVKYFDFIGRGLGFNTVKGECLMTCEPISAATQRKSDLALAGLAKRFHARLAKPAFPAPGLFRLMIFRTSRTRIRLELDDRSLDWRHYSEKGWFGSDYYYPTRLGPMKRAVGRLFDAVGRRSAGHQSPSPPADR